MKTDRIWTEIKGIIPPSVLTVLRQELGGRLGVRARYSETFTGGLTTGVPLIVPVLSVGVIITRIHVWKSAEVS